LQQQWNICMAFKFWSFFYNYINGKGMMPAVRHSQATDAVFYYGSNKTDLMCCYSK
jgi:hypothetical protein